MSWLLSAGSGGAITAVSEPRLRQPLAALHLFDCLVLLPFCFFLRLASSEAARCCFKNVGQSFCR